MRTCLVRTHPGVFLVLRPAQGTGTGQRSMYIRILLLLILKSRALTTITQRIERDVKKIRDYATVFRDSGREVKYPGLSRKIREGWQVCIIMSHLHIPDVPPVIRLR